MALLLGFKKETYRRTLTSPFGGRLVLSLSENWGSSMLYRGCLVRYCDMLMCHCALPPISLEVGRYWSGETGFLPVYPAN